MTASAKRVHHVSLIVTDLEKAEQFYGSILGLFLVAFFLRSVRGSAVFFAALLAQMLVLVLFWTLSISYLWYNLIGCVAVLLFSVILQRTVFLEAVGA